MTLLSMKPLPASHEMLLHFRLRAEVAATFVHRAGDLADQPSNNVLQGDVTDVGVGEGNIAGGAETSWAIGLHIKLSL